jgi:beta-glucosidase
VVVVAGDTVILNGETRDRTLLDLTGAQLELLNAIKNTGKPMVVVLVNGKPLTIPWIKENADAILETWNPGMEGGNAVASVLFGDFNPCGKLTISFPYNIGQQPVYYNQYGGWHGGRYIDAEPEPLYSFGYGMSYTSFEYSGLTLSSRELKAGDELTVSVNVKNTGKFSGTEVVQVYVNDIYSSVTTPIRELKGFTRVHLAPGESKTAEIKIPVSDLLSLTWSAGLL